MYRQEKALSFFAYLFGALGFFPFLGAPFSIVAIFWGLASTREDGKSVALIGLFGFLWQAAFFALVGFTFFAAYTEFGKDFMVKYKEAQDGNTKVMEYTIRKKGNAPLGNSSETRRSLNMLTAYIEDFEKKMGHYPADLQALRQAYPPSLTLPLYDPATIRGRESEENQAVQAFRAQQGRGAEMPAGAVLFHYESDGVSTYKLFAVGPDGAPNTPDDIYPGGE